MNFHLKIAGVAGAVLLVLAPGWVRADGQLSAERLDAVDKLGYFTPGFKQAVHDYIYTKTALAQAKADAVKMNQDMPSLEEQLKAEQAAAQTLRAELERYEHPEEIDFEQLQAKMNDPQATEQEQLQAAQAYVWTYPSSRHASEAFQFLEMLQKKQADEQLAEKNTEAQQAAEHAALVKRAENRDLSVDEWRDFLRNMSQEDLINLMGHPNSMENDDWIYEGWATNGSASKVGLEISFEGGRVFNVIEKLSSP